MLLIWTKVGLTGFNNSQCYHILPHLISYRTAYCKVQWRVRATSGSSYSSYAFEAINIHIQTLTQMNIRYEQTQINTLNVLPIK
jgi:hypothetical protein